MGNEVNLPPTVSVVGEIPPAEVGIEMTVDLSITDADAGQTHTGELVESPPGSSLAPDGLRFSWTPEAAGTFDVTVRITDDGSPPPRGRQFQLRTALESQTIRFCLIR